MRTKEGDASSTVPEEPSRPLPASSTDVRLAQRIALPNDLSTSLRYLGDAELQRLLVAVSKEISRRSQVASTSDTGKTAATAASQSVATRNKASDVQEIPEGRANLIRASFGAGLKPAAIARTFGVSPSLVKRIISSTEKPKR